LVTNIYVTDLLRKLNSWSSLTYFWVGRFGSFLCNQNPSAVRSPTDGVWLTIISQKAGWWSLSKRWSVC